MIFGQRENVALGQGRSWLDVICTHWGLLGWVTISNTQGEGITVLLYCCINVLYLTLHSTQNPAHLTDCS